MSFDLETWQVIGGGIAAIAIGLENRLSQRKTRKVAQKAVELAEPTGNGFAKKVTESLARIETKLERTEEKIDHHIVAHADAEVAHRTVRSRRILKNVNEL